MKSCKTALIFLVALSLILLCAALPELTMEMIDRTGRNQPIYSTISPIQLNFSSRTRIPILGKLALLKNSTTVEITESEASMTPAEAVESMKRELQPYLDQGLFPDDSLSVPTATPILAYRANNPLEYVILWGIEQVQKDPPYLRFQVILDDETGKLLCLDFEMMEDFYDNDLFDNLSPDAYCETVAEQYFSALELEPPVPEIQENTDWSTYTSVTYRFGDVIYGEVSITFNLYPLGFYLYFDG